MVYHYAFQGYDTKTMARGVGLFLRGVSRKDALEIARSLRNKPVKKIVSFLESVIAMDTAVPYRRFNHGVGHRKGGMGPGRYPVKAAAAYLKLVKSVAANAVYKNLNEENLVICHICVQKGPNQPKSGRHGGRMVKQCHIEIAITEQKVDVKEAKKERAPVKKEAKKEMPKSAEVAS